MRPLSDGDRDVLAEQEADARECERCAACEMRAELDAEEYADAFPTRELSIEELNAMRAEFEARHPDGPGDDSEFPF